MTMVRSGPTLARSGPTLAVAVALISSACAGDPAPDVVATSTSRDSVGVTIIEHVASETLPDLPWSIGTAPVLSIGEAIADEAEQLFGVEDAIRLPDGRILVANGSTGEIRVFDEAGRHEASWGREGEGPGEFTGLVTLAAWAGDSILAWDFAQNRMTTWDLDGTLGRTQRLIQGEGLGAAQLRGVLPDGSFLTASLLSFAPGEVTTGLVRRSRRFARTGSDGALLTDFGEREDEEYYVRPEVGAIVRHPFRRSVHSAIWNDLVVIGTNDRFEIRAYDPTGPLRRIVRVEHPLEPVTPEDVQREVDARLAEADDRARPTLERVFEGMPPVPTFPAFSSLLVDSEGDLWVREYARPGVERSSWLVFSEDGVARGRMLLPEGLEVYRIGRDFVLGKALDDFEVERVQLWRLTREAG